MSQRFVRPLIIGTSFLAFPFTQADAALLVYEGYNGYSDIDGTAPPNANTIGLNTTINYAGNFTGNPSIGTGLSLASLQVSGEALAVNGGTVVAGAQLNLATPYTGTLYGSYLFNLTTRGAGAGDGAEVRLSNDDATGGNRFRSFADSRSSSTGPAISYSGTINNGSGTISTGTTYIAISRFTNVGVALDPATTGTATNWILDANEFNLFKSAPDPEAYLDAAVVGVNVTGMSASTAVETGQFLFQAGNRVQFVQVNDVGRIDEIRYGSSLADVTPVPEPATIGLLTVAAGLLLSRRRRRCAVPML